MKVYVVSVDLTAPGISFVATERVKDWGVRMDKVKNRTCLAETRLETTANFTLSLQEAPPARLDFDCLTGDRYQGLLSPADYVNRRLSGERKEFLEKCAQCKIASGGVVGRIFKSPDAVHDARRFARDLFVCASICQCLRSELGGMDLYRFFAREEIAGIFHCLEMHMYGGMANSPELGDAHVACTKSIAADFMALLPLVRLKRTSSERRITSETKQTHNCDGRALCAFYGCGNRRF